MAAFSSIQHHHPFLLDSSVFLPNTPSTINEPNIINTCFISQFYQIENPHQIILDKVSTKVISSSSASASAGPSINSTTITMDSSSIVTQHDKYDHIQSCDQVMITPKLNNNTMDKKRKSKEGSSANSAQSKDKREVKGKKQKKMKNHDEEKKKEEKKATQKEAPKGYIHVRARRGQATDSHSLAERVRREKISERMKLLQAIVPGCDKVTGKALMLDEIINYVQSLQNQVEFLSMKLASVNPMYYEFGMEYLESFMVRPDQDLSNLASSPLASMQECSPTTANNYPPLLDNISANSFLFQQPQNVFPQPQGSRQTTLWELDDELRQENMNQSGIHDHEQQPAGLVSFHQYEL